MSGGGRRREVPAELRSLVDQLCRTYGLPNLQMKVIRKDRASFVGAKMLIEVPSHFGTGASYERWTIAHEVGHAFQQVHDLDQAKARIDAVKHRVLIAALAALLLAGIAGVLFILTGSTTAGAVMGGGLLMMLILVVADGVWGNAITRAGETAADRLAAEWGHPITHHDAERILRQEPWWARRLPLWARSHPRPWDRHLATNPSCSQCRSVQGEQR